METATKVPTLPRNTRPSNQRKLTVGALGGIMAFLGGVTVGCRSKVDNPGHCYVANGDRTCADRYGDQRPFCVGPGDGCFGAQDNDGCVVELPPAECYSPCGDGAFVDEDQSCLGTADDSDTESGDAGGGDGDGDGDGDGNGDEPEPICGDGSVDLDEECDDGNAIDNDDCTNTCTTPTCGDGIVQTALDESCDDGNTEGGDGCTANCILSGTVIWTRYSDLPNATGRSVIVTSTNDIGIIAYSSDLGTRVLRLDPTGSPTSNEAGPAQPTNIATDSNGRLIVGGIVGDKGQIWKYYSTGLPWWVREVPAAPTSTVSAVALSTSGNSIAVGSAYGAGFILRYSGGGVQLAYMTVMGTTTLDAVEAGSDDSAWLLRRAPRKVEHRDPSDQQVWVSPEITVGDLYADLAVDQFGKAYVVGNVPGGVDSFGVVSLDESGAPIWMSVHDDEQAMVELALAVATLPTGGVIVAGSTAAEIQGTESDALLTWFGPDGTLMGDFVFDGAQADDTDSFEDVAVGPDGNLVAVGWHRPSGGDYQLWTVKVAF